MKFLNLLVCRENDIVYMPGEFLDAMNKEDVSLYVADDLAAWYLEDKPQTKKARTAVKGKNEEEINGDR